MLIEECCFENIWTSNSILYDGALAADVIINRTIFDNKLGSIYHSWHQYDSTVVFHNVSITSNQLGTFKENGLLIFASDDVVIISSLDILYKYNASQSCYYSDTSINSVIGAAGDTYFCSNQISAIQNSGKVQMHCFFKPMLFQ